MYFIVKFSFEVVNSYAPSVRKYVFCYNFLNDGRKEKEKVGAPHL